jgi:uncharacterized protein
MNDCSETTRPESIIIEQKADGVILHRELPSQKAWVAHSFEEILAEKLRSLLTRAEPRDLYDIYYILNNQIVDVEEMKFGMTEKFTAKGFVISDLNSILEKREKVFQRLWEGRLGGQMPDIPPLNTVIRETNRILQRHF